MSQKSNPCPRCNSSGVCSCVVPVPHPSDPFAWLDDEGWASAIELSNDGCERASSGAGSGTVIIPLISG
jgi:hypothetical protein